MFMLIGLVGCAEDSEPATTPEPTPEVVETPAPEPTPEVVETPTPEPTPEPETETEEIPTSNVTGENASDLTDGTNYWLEVNGVRFSVGDPFALLLEHFTLNPREEDVKDEVLPPNRYVLLTLFYEIDGTLGSHFSARIANLTNEDIYVREGRIYGFSIDENAGERFTQHSFFNGIQIGVTTKDEIVGILGEPTSTMETEAFGRTTERFAYEPIPGNFNAFYNFTFEQETGLLLRVNFSFHE